MRREKIISCEYEQVVIPRLVYYSVIIPLFGRPVTGDACHRNFYSPVSNTIISLVKGACLDDGAVSP